MSDPERLRGLKDEIALTVWIMVGLHVGKNNPECYPEERLRVRLQEKLGELASAVTPFARGPEIARQLLGDELEALMTAGSPRVPWVPYEEGVTKLRSEA